LSLISALNPSRALDDQLHFYWREGVRVQIPMMVLCALLVAAGPAFAARQKDHDDCNARDPDRNIAGCTRLIEDDHESAKVRSIAYVGRGLAWQSKGDRDRAMADFSAAIRLDPDNSLAYSDRGILWREKNDVDRAIADFSEAIRIEALPRSDLPGPGYVNVYTNRGLAWQAKGDLDHALSDYDKAISLDSRNAEAFYYRAKVYLEKRDFERGIADLDAAIGLDPNRLEPYRADAYYLRGAAHYDSYMFASEWIEPDDLNRAIADFTEAIKLDPQRIPAYRGRALAWNVDGDRDRAIADLTRAVELNPMNTETVALLRQLKPDYKLPSIAKDGILKSFSGAAKK
jgi:tetratricopeptide (TPR) repeat protein